MLPGRLTATTCMALSSWPANMPSRSRIAEYTERTSGISSISHSSQPNRRRNRMPYMSRPMPNTATTATSSPMPVRYHSSGMRSSTCLPKKRSSTVSIHTAK